MPPTHIPLVTGNWKGQQINFRPDRLVVSVRPGSQVGARLAAVSLLIENSLHVQVDHVVTPGRSWSVFKFAAQAAPSIILDLAGMIAARPDIRYAEPAVIGHTHLDSTDPKIAEEWWPGTIRIGDAWGLTTGNDQVLLGIMDSGISITGSAPDHPDLNTSRYIVRHGTVMHDYVSGDDVPRDEHYDGHGTHVTGIASADGDNGIGVAGVNWKCPVYIARVADGCGHFGSDDLKTAVADLLDYATGVYDRVVVNMSMGTQTEIAHLHEMCEDAATFAGEVLFVCAAGRLNSNSVDIDWPAAYAADYDFVIAVSATNKADAPSELIRDNYDQITVFAPGNNIYSTMPTYERSPCTESDLTIHNSGYKEYGPLSGTSMAAPLVSGVASLMWTLNDGLSAADIIALIKSTAQIIQYQKRVIDSSTGAVTWPWTPHIRLDAGTAVESARPLVKLEETNVLFSDVAVGDPVEKSLVFDVGSECTLTFEVVEDSISFPGTLSVSPLSGEYTAGMGGFFKLIIVKYEPAVAGDISYGEFRVKCIQACREWTVSVTANAAAVTSTAVVIVADKSGSMAEPSGIEALTRMQVLQEASSIVVETMRVGDAVGVVGFSTEANAAVPMTDIVGADPLSAERISVKTKIGGLVADGTTSIGAGVELANSMLAGDARPRQGMMVLTDGRENTAPTIFDIMDSVGVPVYAIGMGTAEALQPDTLEALADATGGYLLLTDQLDDTARFRVAKYALQMLAGMSGEGVVLDPTTLLRPRQTLSMPFSLCSDDRSCAVTLLTPWPDLVQMTVRGPDERDVATHGEGIQRITGTRAVCHRFRLPLRETHAGEWSVLLSIDENVERELRERSAAAGYRVPAAPCSVLVTARSAVRMSCRAVAALHRPGSTVTLRAAITRRGRGYDEHVRVVATIRRREDEPLHVTLARSAPGVFEGTFVASQNGVYECIVRASGSIPGMQRFSREQTVTAHIWSGDTAMIDLDRAKEHESRRRTS